MRMEYKKMFNKIASRYKVAYGLWKYNNELKCNEKINQDDYDIIIRRCYSKHCNCNCVYFNRNECDGNCISHDYPEYGHVYKVIKNSVNADEGDIFNFLNGAVKFDKFEGWQ